MDSTMDHTYITDIPSPTEPHDSEQISIFTPPIFIEMGEESSEYLEALVKENTGVVVEADEDWTPLSGHRSIDASVVGGFMFQSDAGCGCSVQVSENGNRPIRILIDEEQEFGMFLVIVLSHEEWTTSGDFHLRFLRRVPVLDKRCTARTEGPFAGPVPSPSDSDLSIFEELESFTDNVMKVEDEEKQEVADQTTTTDNSPPGQTAYDTWLESVYVVPLANEVETCEDGEELTDDEDHRWTGAAALKGTGGGIVPPGAVPATTLDPIISDDA